MRFVIEFDVRFFRNAARSIPFSFESSGFHAQYGIGNPSGPVGHGASKPGIPCSPFSPCNPGGPRSPTGPRAPGNPISPFKPVGPTGPGLPYKYKKI